MPTSTTVAVLGLAVLDMLSPALVGVTIYVLVTRPRRLPLLLSVYLGTVATAYYALGVVLMLGLGAIVPAIDADVWAWIQGGVGIALFAGSWFIPEDDRAAPRPGRAARPLTVPAMVALGLGTWAFEFYTAVPYFGAVAIMTSAELPAPTWLFLLAVYACIMVLPGIALAAVHALAGHRLARLERWQQRLEANSRRTLSWVVGIAGVLVFLDALPEQITVGGP